jgi:hypothetical protein
VAAQYGETGQPACKVRRKQGTVNGYSDRHAAPLRPRNLKLAAQMLGAGREKDRHGDHDAHG